MKTLALLRTFALAAVPALAPAAAFAAHAGAPYTNVDHSNDMGNDTGDFRVEGLNSAQLNENYRGPVQMRAPAMIAADSAHGARLRAALAETDQRRRQISRNAICRGAGDADAGEPVLEFRCGAKAKHPAQIKRVMERGALV